MSNTSFGWLRARAAALFVFAALALAFLPAAAHAQTLQTLTIYGTDAAPGTIDPNTDCSKDGDVTWLPAYALTPLHPWQTQYPIPGTTRWIGRSADGQSAPGVSQSNPEVLDFRIRFYAPSDISSPSMTFVLDPDNFGDIYLNGTKINSQQVTGPSVQTFTVSSANIKPGLNTIIVRLTDWGGWLGINYSVTLQGYGSTPFQRLIAPPSPTNVAATTNGTFGLGSVIPVQVTFNRAVTVTGTPTLTLETGSTDRTATYASGSGTNVLTFNYTVQGNDTSSDLDYVSAAALALNGGTIKATAADLQDANLALPSPGATGSLGANNAIVVDGVQPVATLTSTAPNSTNVSPIPVTITFSEPVTGLTASDFIVTNGTVGTVTGSGTSYSATIFPVASPSAVTVSLPSNAVQDLAGNPNPASGSVTRTYDTNPPTVVLSSTAPSITNAWIPVTFTFSEVVTNFTGAGITATNGSVVNILGSGNTYTATIVPINNGTVTVKLAANSAQDLAGNGNQASATLTYTYDRAAPTVSVTSSSPSVVNTPFVATFTFSEPVVNFIASDISTTGATVSNFSSDASGTVYTATVTPTGPNVLVWVNANVATDLAGNNNTSSNTLSRGYDITPPNVASIVRQSPTSSPTGADTLKFRVSFTENVTGVTAGSFTVTGTTATASVATVTGSVYDVTVAGGDLANLNGTVTLGFAATQAITDTAGNALVNTAPLGTNNNTFSVINDQAPTDLALSSSTLNQTAATAGASVGTLSTIDPDAGDTFTYSLVAGTGSTHNAAFAISGATLKVGGSALNIGTFSVRVRTTDRGGLFIEKAFTITVVDNVAPVITVPTSPMVVEATGATGASVTFTASAYDAHDGDVPVTLSPVSGGTFALGDTTVTATATDAAGNTATKTFTVSVRDTTAPVISTQGAQTALTIANATFDSPSLAGASFIPTVDSWTKSNDAGVTSLAALGSRYTASPNGSGDQIAYINSGGLWQVLTATIKSGRTYTLSAYVGRRTDDPLAQGAIYLTTANGDILATATSAADQPVGTFALVTASYTAAPNDPNIGAPLRVLLYNPATQQVNFDLVSLTESQDDLFATATSAGGAPVSFSASATDIVSGNVPVNAQPGSGTVFPLGRSVVTLTATDAAGNSTTKTFNVTVNPAVATVTFTTPTYTYDGTAKSATVTTSPAGVPVSFTYNGGSVATPVDAGTYSVMALVNEAWVSGSATGSLTINPANETIFFANTTQSYDGTPRIVTVATNPNGVAASSVIVTYDGSTTPPINAGTYAVQGTFNNPNYTGTNSTTLIVGQAHADVALTNNLQFFDGTPKAMTVTTTPAGLATTVTYNGSPTVPTAVGTYNVVAVVHDNNYAGVGNGVLQIRDNTPPVLSLPGNIVAEATSLRNTVVTFSGSATDNVDGNVAVTFSPASGSTFPLGSTTVNATARDAAGNTARGSFTVTVQDTTKPALQLPADLTAEATSASGAVVNFAATATDAVGIPMVLDGFENTTPAYALNTSNYVVFGGSPVTANGWVFSGYGGYLTGNGGGFAPVTQTDGQQFAFVQSYHGAMAHLETAKKFHVYAGATYIVSFMQSARAGFGDTTYNVTLNGANGSTELFRRTTSVGEPWKRYFATFTPTADGDYTLAFNAVAVSTDDATFYLDDVALLGTKVAVDTTPASGSTFALGTTAVNAAVTDFAGNTQAGSFNVTVQPTTATIALTTPAYTYDGTPKPATATVSPAGVPVAFTYDGGSADAPINAGTHTVSAVVNQSWVHGAADGNVVIAKADAVIAVNPYSVTYDGNEHTSTGVATGVGGARLAGLDLSRTAHTNAGAYHDTWAFTDVTGNYNDASDRVENAIAQATPTIAVTPYSVTYDGSAHVATGRATGAKGETLAGLALDGTTHTNAGTFKDAWTFTDVTGNYTGASGIVTDAIAKANATVNVAAYRVTYDGNVHVATGSAKGVSGEALAGLDLSATTHTAAGNYDDKWTFTDATGNYNNAAATVTDSIAKAAATIVVTPYSVTYDTAAHTATGSATGVKGEALVGLNLTHTTHTDAGTYTDAWTFNDITGNYDVATANVTDKIAKAAATITLGSLAQQYDGAPKPVTATTAPANLKVDITYAGSTTAPTLPGSYTVVATISDPNYTGTVTDTLAIGATALIRHGITIDGDIDGSIQVLTAEASTLNGNAGITGDLLVPGTPTVRLNGHPTFGGTRDSTGAATPSNYTVTLNGNALLRYLVRHVDPLPMPVVAAPAAPTGTRSVNLNKATDPIGTWSTVKDLTLNGNVGNIAVLPGTYGNLSANGNSGFILGVAGSTTRAVYNLQNLTMNGNTVLKIVGPVTITLANGVNLNGDAGETAHPDWLVLRVANGGVTLNGNVKLNGDVIAPNGTVVINGNSVLTGHVTADRLTLNGNSLLQESDTP